MDSKSVLVGVGVGVLDLSLVYPLAVLACRREAGQSLGAAVRAGRLWSGATAQLSLIPYSIAVEAGTKAFRDRLNLSPVAAALALSSFVSLGLQPIERVLIMSQLLQGQQQAPNPITAIASFARQHGLAHLYKGLSPLALREFIYIASISAVNPKVVSVLSRRSGGGALSRGAEAAGAFAVGFSAGLISAPCQTVNAMMKDEARNSTRSLSEVVRGEVFGRGLWPGVVRLYYGAATRSTRCGGAGLLYYLCRTAVGAER